MQRPRRSTPRCIRPRCSGAARTEKRNLSEEPANFDRCTSDAVRRHHKHAHTCDARAIRVAGSDGRGAGALSCLGAPRPGATARSAREGRRQQQPSSHSTAPDSYWYVCPFWRSWLSQKQKTKFVVPKAPMRSRDGHGTLSLRVASPRRRPNLPPRFSSVVAVLLIRREALGGPARTSRQ